MEGFRNSRKFTTCKESYSCIDHIYTVFCPKNEKKLREEKQFSSDKNQKLMTIDNTFHLQEWHRDL